MGIEIFKGSILDSGCEAIVNPANSFMRHDGGLARAIDQAASQVPEHLPTTAVELAVMESVIHYYIRDSREVGLIPYGGAVKTGSGALMMTTPITHIIHTVGPIWGGGEYHEEDLLMSAYDSALTIAEEAGFESVAFPAISAGIFGCPIDLVASAAVTQAASTSVDRVVFALMEDEHVTAFEDAIAAARMMQIL